MASDSKEPDVLMRHKTGYELFGTERLHQLCQLYVDDKPIDLVLRVSKEWKALSAEEKAGYEKLAVTSGKVAQDARKHGSSFHVFRAERRPQLVKMHPDVTDKEIEELLLAEWKEKTKEQRWVYLERWMTETGVNDKLLHAQEVGRQRFEETGRLLGEEWNRQKAAFKAEHQKAAVAPLEQGGP